MQVLGRITYVLPERSGQNKRTGLGWISRGYVITTFGQYPKDLAFDVFGQDRIENLNIQLGEVLEVTVDVSSRQGNNGGWFTSASGYKVERDPQRWSDKEAAAIVLSMQPQLAEETASESTDTTKADQVKEELDKATQEGDLPF